MAKQIEIIITRAVSIDGKIISPSNKAIPVDEPLAKNLFDRGRAKPATASGAGDDVPYSEWKVPQLKARAKHLEIEGADGMKKDELVDAIEKAEAA